MHRATVGFIIKHTFYVQISFPENSAVYEIMWKKYGAAKQVTDGNIKRRMLIARYLSKSTNTHSEYVILIAFPWQQ